jgi:hypothetical protein
VSEKSTFKWIIGVIIALIAAGGGAVTWIKFFTEPSKDQQTQSWKLLQPAYVESFDIQYTDERMRSLWPSFKEGAWSATTKNGTYCYANRLEENGVRYNYVEITGEDISDTPASAEVKTTPLDNSTPISGAGLLYRFDKKNRFYYAFTLTNKGVTNLYKRNREGFNLLYTGRADGFLPDKFNRVAIIGRGSTLHLYVNDSLVKKIEDQELQRGITGVVGVGIGTHCFDNVTIYKNVARIPE